MHYRTKHRRTIVVYLTAEDIYRLMGSEPETRIIVANLRADGDRGVVVELVETEQVLDKQEEE